MAEINSGNILVVDDEKDICRALEFVLLGEGYSITTAFSGEEAIERMKRTNFDVVLTDLRMERVDGIAVLEEAKRLNPDTSVILVTAYASVESAVDAMKKGAADYIVKPFINEDIKITVGRAMEQIRLRSENLALRMELSRRRSKCKEVVFTSESMQKIFTLLETVIPTKSNILLLGESGTGKGLIAEIIHCNSPRSDSPFMAVNCSAIPETLLESELFGYRKGAFTGAVSDKKGLIKMADGGTLFLDEIGDMSPALQSKLLKVIESGEAMPLGDAKPVRSDVRLIAATNQDLGRRIKEGAFREDLYYRLSVIELTIPPLRQRQEDILPIAELYLKKFAFENGKAIRALASEAEEALLSYPWPGNVRELANVIERAVIICDTEAIQSKCLPPKVTARADEETFHSLKELVGGYERDVILRTLEAHSRNKEETARALGMDIATLYRKMKKLGIES